MMLIMLIDLGENVLSISSRLFVSLPRIYRIAFCRQVAFDNRLAKRKIGVTGMRA